ncbi:MAG TPA: ABC transporter permease, partial [Bryobacteraceae bacterium]
MLYAFFRNLFRQRRMDQELDDELRSYLELTTAENIRRGMAPEAAAEQARRDLGGMTQVKENVRDVRAGVGFEILMQDVRYAIRSLRKNPGFTLITILTLTLGIGANTTIFSVVNGVLLKPLPYIHPDRLVSLWESHPAFGQFLSVAPANFYDWRALNSTFDKMAALNPYPDYILTGMGQPHRLTGADVTADFFPLLGVKMELGRNFQATEHGVVVLSYSTWQNYFGARAGIVGKQVRLNDSGYTVVGVLPRDFYLVSKSSDFQARTQFDVWTNLGLTSPPEAWMRGTHPLSAFGRLKPGVSLQQAQADLDRIAANLRRLYPDNNKDKTIRAVPLEEHAVADVRTALFTLLAAVAMVLLIACANIANLLLTRAAARRKEMALRAALGASRMRLVRQLLTESAVLAFLGSSLGLVLALWSVPALVRHLPADLPRISEIAVDTHVLMFTALLTLVTGMLFGMVPLFQSEGVRLNVRGASAGQARLRHALIVAQVSIALVLLAAAGLMTKSLRALLEVSPGFQTAHILTARFSLPPRYANGYKFGTGQHRRISAFQHALADRVRNIPGVE